MTGSLLTTRKRVLFRSWHRGTREADLVLGSFADRYVDTFDESQLHAYELLLDEPDPDLWEWITGNQPPPRQHDNEVMMLLRNFSYMPRPR